MLDLVTSLDRWHIRSTWRWWIRGWWITIGDDDNNNHDGGDGDDDDGDDGDNNIHDDDLVTTLGRWQRKNMTTVDTRIIAKLQSRDCWVALRSRNLSGQSQELWSFIHLFDNGQYSIRFRGSVSTFRLQKLFWWYCTLEKSWNKTLRNFFSRDIRLKSYAFVRWHNQLTIFSKVWNLIYFSGKKRRIKKTRTVGHVENWLYLK